MSAPAITDPRPVYRGATAWVTQLLRGVRADQLSLPTPCDEFDVRRLSQHLVGTVARAVAVAETGDAESVSGFADEFDAAAFERSARRAEQVWADDSLLTTPVRVPWGEVPGGGALWGYVNEALVHGWDLAVATGQNAEADPALVEPTAAVARQFIGAEIRVPGVPFAPVVEPRAAAGPTERLANWSGRVSAPWVS